MLENNGLISNNPPGPDTARRSRHWIWPVLAVLLLLLAVWVLNASRPGSRVEGCPEGCATAASRSAGPLRVLSLNMLHGFPTFAHLEDRLALIESEIRRLDPDIICLQEVPWHWGNAARDLAERVGLNYVFLRANGNHWTILFEEGEAILSRYPLRDYIGTELEASAGPFEHRVALQATAVTPWGDLRVVSTHLTHGDPAVNEAQAASLIALVAVGRTDTPAIVAGDFNAREESSQIRALRAEGWIDTYRAVHPNDPGLTCCTDDLTDPAQALDKRIDYVFLVPGSHAFEVTNSRVILDYPVQYSDGWLWASDHAGLLTEFMSPP